MERIKRVACINDLSGFGRCSLTVALPVLAAMGFQPCPVPTVLLSAHTGYESPYIRDFTEDMDQYLHHWEQLGLQFEAVCTGFLGDARQVELLREFLTQKTAAGAFCLVDPAMADHGRLYASCSPDLVDAMGALAPFATVMTPNLTEACLLTGEDYAAVMALSPEVRRLRLAAVCRELLKKGCGAVVITGVPVEDGVLANVVMRADEAEPEFLLTDHLPHNYAGTGDVFSAVLCGKLLQGMEFHSAVAQSAAFVGRVLRHTARLELPEQDGIQFEPFLRELTPETP